MNPQAIRQAAADLRPVGPAGDDAGAVRRQVDYLLDAAHEMLLDVEDGNHGAAAEDRAAEHIGAAIEVLEEQRQTLARVAVPE